MSRSLVGIPMRLTGSWGYRKWDAPEVGQPEVGQRSRDLKRSLSAIYRGTPVSTPTYVVNILPQLLRNSTDPVYESIMYMSIQLIQSCK